MKRGGGGNDEKLDFAQKLGKFRQLSRAVLKNYDDKIIRGRGSS